MPDNLTTAIREAINEWAVGGYAPAISYEESVELTNYLAPVIAEHLDQLAPPRGCCPSRRGQAHQNCKALSEALNEEAHA